MYRDGEGSPILNCFASFLGVFFFSFLFSLPPLRIYGYHRVWLSVALGKFIAKQTLTWLLAWETHTLKKYGSFSKKDTSFRSTRLGTVPFDFTKSPANEDTDMKIRPEIAGNTTETGARPREARDIEKAGLAAEEFFLDRMHLVNGGGSNHYQSPAITDVASGSASSSNLEICWGALVHIMDPDRNVPLPEYLSTPASTRHYLHRLPQVASRGRFCWVR